jgi:putative DNA methylase
MTRKLIEVSFPLDRLNDLCIKEKSIRHGHPCTLHLYWARRPLAACTAVFFAGFIDDPGDRPDLYPTVDAQKLAREQLHDLIVAVSDWANWNNPETIALGRDALLRQADGNLPIGHDPFAGGGSIPFTQQRLGLRVTFNDLNPLALLINKALTEIPGKFANHPPVNKNA